MLNWSGLQFIGSLIANSNTTLVNVKLTFKTTLTGVQNNSNTTLVNVKYGWVIFSGTPKGNSNTTLVNVK